MTTTINKTRYHILKSALTAISNDYWTGMVSVEDESSLEEPILTWEVNWKCCGSQQPEHAEMMATSLQQAANITHCLNSANIVLDYTDDPIIADLRAQEDDDTARSYIDALRDTLVQDLDSMPRIGEEDWTFCLHDVIGTLTAEYTTLVQGQ